MKRFRTLFICALLLTTIFIGSLQTVNAVLPGLIIPIQPVFNLPVLTIETNSVAVNSIPLYRFRSPSGLLRHNYTTGEANRTYIKSLGWLDDGIITYLSPIYLPGYRALYKCVFANWICLLTTVPADAVSKGYVNRGIVGFVPYSMIPTSEQNLVYRSSRSIPPGGDYHYVNFYFHTEQNHFPGYNFPEQKFVGWKTQQAIQEIKLGSIATGLTGNNNLNISWSTTVPGGAVEILYSTDNGANYVSVIKNLANTVGNQQYLWKLPNITSSQFRVMVKWSAVASTPATAWARSSKLSITKNPDIVIIQPIFPLLELLKFSPADPSNLTTEPGTTATKEIKLFWQDNSVNETGFNLERRTESGSYAKIATLAANATSYTDTSVVNKTNYFYRIEATGTLGDSGYSNEAEGKYITPGFSLGDIIPDFEFDLLFPSAPIGLAANIATGTEKQIQLAWVKGAGTVTSYLVERKTTAAWEIIGTTINQLNYLDTTLDAAVQAATYRVKAVNDTFESLASNEALVNFTSGAAPVFDGSQSSWAEADITQAYNWGLTYPEIMQDFKDKITREQFCVISVKLYEKLTGSTVIPDVSPFNDTDNADILKAFKLGIVLGITADKFAPNNNITRQEMCVMIYRALQAAGKPTTVLTAPAFTFADKNKIAPWALDEVRFCNQNDIMKGTSPTTISPLVNTPIEQAIMLVKRTYDSFK